MPRVDIFDTTLRESVNTLRQSTLRASEVASLAELMDKVGFTAVDAWGGATFDVCMRYLNEDPWDRLRVLNEKFRRTPVKILIRGQNFLGYRPVPIDLIEAASRHLVKYGIRFVRVFDSLNDIDNLELVIRVLIDAGLEVEGGLVYTQSPVHSTETFIAAAARLAELGCESIGLTDVAGMMTPAVVRELVAEIAMMKPVNLHARSSSGMASMTYLAAVEAGVRGLDCTIGPFGASSSLPTVEAMLEAFVDTDQETTIDRAALRACSKKGESLAVKHVISNDDQRIVDNTVSVHKVSVGMLSGLFAELKSMNALDKLGEVLAEVTRVREDFGWPPLITPISQMVSSQAIHNVIRGSRYSIMSKEVKDYLKGMYGRPPGEINPELTKNLTTVSGRAALLLRPVMEDAEAELRRLGLFQKEEDAITYALFGQLAMSFFRARKEPSKPRSHKHAADAKLELLSAYMQKRGLARLAIGGPDFRVNLVRRRPDERPVREYVIDDAGSDSSFEEEPAAGEKVTPGGTPIGSPLTGLFYRSSAPGAPPFVEAGSEVEEDTVIGLIETMKLFHEVKAGARGVFQGYAVENGETVESGSPVAFLE